MVAVKGPVVHSEAVSPIFSYSPHGFDVIYNPAHQMKCFLNPSALFHVSV